MLLKVRGRLCYYRLGLLVLPEVGVCGVIRYGSWYCYWMLLEISRHEQWCGFSNGRSHY